MTTKAKGITLPVWNYLRMTNGFYEVSANLTFTDNHTYSFTSNGISPSSPTAPNALAPADVSIQAQNANGGFAAHGGDFFALPGTGTGGNPSGNFRVRDTAGNGGAWNTSHLTLGAYHLWVDAAARLRIKSSAPAADTDGAVVSYDYIASAVYDPPNLADGAGTTTTVAVAGAVLGDFAIVSFSLDLQGILLTAYVSAANVISCRFQNETGGALDLASGTLRVKVIKQ